MRNEILIAQSARGDRDNRHIFLRFRRNVNHTVDIHLRAPPCSWGSSPTRLQDVARNRIINCHVKPCILLPFSLNGLFFALRATFCSLMWNANERIDAPFLDFFNVFPSTQRASKTEGKTQRTRTAKQRDVKVFAHLRSIFQVATAHCSFPLLRL